MPDFFIGQILLTICNQYRQEYQLTNDQYFFHDVVILTVLQFLMEMVKYHNIIMQ